MHSLKLWLSGHMSQRRFVVWVWRGYKGPRTVQLIYSFSYQESSPKYGAWILITALCPHQTQPPAHEPFWPTRGISFKGTCTVMIWNPTSLGCYSKPDLHQILLQDVEGSSAGRRSPHEHPMLCHTLPAPPLASQQLHPSFSILTPCMYFYYVNNLFWHITIFYTVNMFQPFEY